MMEFIPRASLFAALPDGFSLKRGGRLYGARVAFETVGQLNAERTNAVLVLTGLSPDAHVCASERDPSPGWWEPMVGPGKPIDTERWFVICVNSLGSCKGSTGPASTNPATGRPYGLDFPAISIEDIADAAVHAVRSLGVEELAVVAGASMGAMTALSLVARHPGLARHMINLSGAVHAQPLAIAIRSLQREAIQADPQWRAGRYDARHYPLQGMLVARKLGLITYRSATEWNERFGRERLDPAVVQAQSSFGMDFSVEGYLACHAHRFVRSFDPNAYLYLSRAIDWFDLGEELDGPSDTASAPNTVSRTSTASMASSASSADNALAQLRLDSALVIGVDSDFLFPLAQQRQIADGLVAGGTAVTFVALASPSGHDAFLVDLQGFGPPIAAFMASVAGVTLASRGADKAGARRGAAAELTTAAVGTALSAA